MTELACQVAFSDVGILLSQPIINDSRYDFIADIEGKLYRVQCKSSAPNEDGTAFTFLVSNRNWNGGQKRSYKGEVDFFFTTFEGVDYLIPIDDVGVSSKTLRLKAKTDENNIAWAEDYEFLTSLKKIGYTTPDFVFQDTRDKSYSKKISEVKEVREKKTNYCVDCGGIISPCATRCAECYKKIQRKNSINISREELKMKIRTLPFTTIGKEYNVTDNAIRKWCDKYNLPTRKSDIQSISDEDWELI